MEADGPPWADLPPDLLRDICRHLHDAVDLVRFHSVCRAWRDTRPLPTVTQRHPLLPWLLARSDHWPWDVSCSKLYSVFSNSKTTWRVPRRRRDIWLATADGPGAWLFTTAVAPSPCRLVNPLTGDTTSPLPGFEADNKDRNGNRVDYTDGIICADGTILVYSASDINKYSCHIQAAILHPGDAAWTAVETGPMMYTTFDWCCSAAYHQGSIVFVDLFQLAAVKVRVAGGGDQVDSVRTRIWPPEDNCDKMETLWTYTLVHRGEVMTARVAFDRMPDGRSGDVSVSLYVLEEGDAGDKYHRWVRTDGSSLDDQVLFLGVPTSFAVDAALFGGGEVSGGCAYLVHWTAESVACNLYKYCFRDSSSTLMEVLPSGWNSKMLSRMMWFVPQIYTPTSVSLGVAPTHEMMREQLEEAPTNRNRNRNGPMSIIRLGQPKSLKIYLNNLPQFLVAAGSYWLRGVFRVHGEVTNASVHYHHQETSGFGIVTMTTMDKPADIVAALDVAACFEGLPLSVDFAEERPLQVAPTILHSASRQVFRIHAGNLAWHVDWLRLREFFTDHGCKVTQATVVRDRVTRLSRGFGFVTMLTWDEPAHVIAALNGQILDGRPMQVNFARTPSSNVITCS